MLACAVPLQKRSKMFVSERLVLRQSRIRLQDLKFFLAIISVAGVTTGLNDKVLAVDVWQRSVIVLLCLHRYYLKS